MKNKLLAIVAAGLLVGPISAGALDFQFSFTNSATEGVPGTVTGRILGLQDNSTSAATHVLIDSVPAGLDIGAAGPFPIDAVLWDWDGGENSFTVVNGQVVAGGFWNWQSQTDPSLLNGMALFINGAAWYESNGIDGYNSLYLNMSSGTVVGADMGLAAANIVPYLGDSRIETTFMGGNNFAGNMFDMTVAGGNLIWTGLDVHIGACYDATSCAEAGASTGAGFDALVSVYLREGGYAGFEADSSAWTLVSQSHVVSQGFGSPTFVDIPDYALSANTTYGVYIALSNYTYRQQALIYTNGSVTYSNSDIQLSLGIALPDPDFPGTYTIANRIWNGAIYYKEPTTQFGDLTLEVSPATQAGCRSVTGTVTLSEPAPVGGAVITLSDTLAAATVPTTVSIPEGETTASFLITTSPVSSNQSGSVSATLGGQTVSQSLTLRPIGLASLRLDPLRVVGSRAVEGQAQLECPAGPGPIVVSLESSDPTLANPISPYLVIPQGVQSEQFTVTTNLVPADTKVQIVGTANDTRRSRGLTLKPPMTADTTSLRFGKVRAGVLSEPLSITVTNQSLVFAWINTPQTVSIDFDGSLDLLWQVRCNTPPTPSCTVLARVMPWSGSGKFVATGRLFFTVGSVTQTIDVSVKGTVVP